LIAQEKVTAPKGSVTLLKSNGKGRALLVRLDLFKNLLDKNGVLIYSQNRIYLDAQEE